MLRMLNSWRIQTEGETMYGKALCRTLTLLILLCCLLPRLRAQENLYFGKNKVQYRQFDWHYIQTRHFDIYFYEGMDSIAHFAAQELERANDIIEEQLSYELRRRVPVILYSSHNEFQQTNVVYDVIEEGVGGFTESFKNRIVLPFTGSYEDLRHVLHHELTHAFTYDMLYGDFFGSLLSRQYLFRLPLWFAEGYAEYSSRHGWDYYSDMFVRDATINGYLVPLEYVGGFLAYKEGQSAMLYIAEKYGEEKIAEILNKGKLHLSMDKALKASIGIDTEQLSKDWMKHLKKEYWPEIGNREVVEDFAKRLTDHSKDGSVYNEKPAFSPRGDRLAFFTDRSNYTEIYLISALDGKVIERLLRGEKSGDIESFHSFTSGMAFSPDGNSLAFVSKSEGKDRIFLFSVKKKKIYRRLKLEFDNISDPDWSHDGNLLAFSATKEGAADIYTYNLSTGESRNLTGDLYGDFDPTWSPDGRYLVFSSDRPVTGELESSLVPEGTEPLVGEFWDYSLFKLEVATGEMTPLTPKGERAQYPAWSPDGKRICYVSNRNGIDNLYILELEGGEGYPVSNVLSGCMNPSWSPDGSEIAFSAFQDGGFDIFLLKEIEPVVEVGEELTRTPLLLRKEKGLALSGVETKVTGAPTEPLPEKPKIDYSHYVFKAGAVSPDTLAVEVKDTTAAEDTTEFEPPEGEYVKKPYSAKFSPDYVTGDLSYDTFYGFRGVSYIAISDIFGDHHFYLATNLGNFLDQSQFQLFYNYTPRRIDYLVGIFHSRNYYIDNWDRLFADRMYGAVVGLSYPLSKFNRVELQLLPMTVDRKYYDWPFDDYQRRTLMGDLSYIHDTVIWGMTGPINGDRYIMTYEQSFPWLKNSLEYQALQVDYRRYWRFKQRYNFVFRGSGGAAEGKDPKQYFLGGTGNWIGPRLRNQDNIYGIEDLYFGTMVTPLRGYDYFEFSGDRYVLFNVEFRYPFIDYLKMHFPLPMTLGYINGALFYDMGACWFKDDGFRGVRDDHLWDWKASFGFGARANLGIFVLKFDGAWRTDWATVSGRPRYYFSLGAEF
jgi:Tol biopolymer transport system component